MKRSGLIGLTFAASLILASALFSSKAGASSPALKCDAGNAAITLPQSGADLSGVIQVEGTASLSGGFQYYKLEFSRANREDYVVFSGLVRQQVVNGQLGVWDSASVPDGAYNIRLRVVDTTGNYCEAFAKNLRVSNAGLVQPTPTNSPSVTPSASPTPTPAQTEAPPQFSVVPTAGPVAAPTIKAPNAAEPTPAATQTAPAQRGETRTPAAPSFLPGGINLNSIAEAARELLSGAARTFVFGAIVMAGIFLIVGVIFYVRRVL